MRKIKINIKNEEQLGLAIKQRRKDLGLTQKQVAKFCQLSYNGLSQIELGNQSVRLSTLIRLSEILGFTINLEMESL